MESWLQCYTGIFNCTGVSAPNPSLFKGQLYCPLCKRGKRRKSPLSSFTPPPLQTLSRGEMLKLWQPSWDLERRAWGEKPVRGEGWSSGRKTARVFNAIISPWPSLVHTLLYFWLITQQCLHGSSYCLLSFPLPEAKSILLDIQKDPLLSQTLLSLLWTFQLGLTFEPPCLLISAFSYFSRNPGS